MWELLAQPFAACSSAAESSSGQRGKGSPPAKGQAQEQELGQLRGFGYALSAACGAQQEQVISLLRSWGRLARAGLSHKQLVPGGWGSRCS